MVVPGQRLRHPAPGRQPVGQQQLTDEFQGVPGFVFVAIRPGTYALQVPGSTGETQRVEFAIR